MSDETHHPPSLAPGRQPAPPGALTAFGTLAQAPGFRASPGWGWRAPEHIPAQTRRLPRVGSSGGAPAPTWDVSDPPHLYKTQLKGLVKGTEKIQICCG